MNSEKIEELRVELKEDNWAAHVVNKLCDLALRGLEAGTKTNQCGETCERAKLCYACGKALDESNAKLEAGEPVAWVGCGECDCAFACHEGKARCIRLEPSDMVAVPREQLQKWHAVTAQLCGADEWGREMQDQMWAMISAAPEVKP